jgi:anti-sigma B factor antagonist
MDVEVKTVAETQVVTVIKRFDAYTAGAVESTLNKLITGGARKIVIDFSANEYLASAGLRVLISATKNLQKLGGKLVLCTIKPYVLEVFDISGLKKIFKIYDSADAALADLK